MVILLVVSWAAPLVALHLVSGAGRRFSTSCRLRPRRLGLGLRDHQHVPVGIVQAHLLLRPGSAVADAADADAMSTQMLLECAQVVDVEVEEDALLTAVDRRVGAR